MVPRAARAIVLVWALLTLAGWVALARFTMPYTSDSAVYIEAAENFGAGRGLLVTPYSVEPVDADLHPLAIFPPGYPFLIWAATRLGFDAARAALAVQGACLAVLPILFFLLFRRLVAPSTAVLASLLCTWTSPVVIASLHAWSDVPFLVFALLSLELLFRGIAGNRIGPLFGAGLVGGFACLTRNVGYALVGGELFGLAAAIALRPTVRRAWWRASVAYASGFLGVYGWWILRNLVVVGRLQSYDFDPSDLTFADNVEHLVRTLVTASAGWRVAPFALGIGALAVLALTVLSVHGIRRFRQRPDESTLVVPALAWSTLAVYGLAGAGLLVVARTRYGWGEYINARHILQYHWILIIACIAGFAVLERDYRRGHYVQRLLVVAVAAMFVVVQAKAVYRFLQHTSENAQPELQVVRALAPMIERVPRDALVASDNAPLLSIAARRPVRQINAADTLPWLRDTVTASRDLYVAVVPCRTFCQGLYGARSGPAWLDLGEDTVPAGYEVLFRRDGSALLRASRR